MRFAIRGRVRVALAAAGLVAAAGLSPVLGPAGAVADTATASTYLVLYHAGSATTGAAAAISAAGGTLVAEYREIGVVIARSSGSGFAAALRRSANVDAAVATASFATALRDVQSTDTTAAPAAAPTAWGDSLSGLQWDMRQINVPQAHAINAGSRSVLVGDIDTGLDFTHPDLAPNYDAAHSADCLSGAPAPLPVGNDLNGHGTHTAGTIAAAANGTGIVGVAPHVRIAGIRAGDGDGFFFPEAVICSFMWAANNGIQVTNNSYFADPWLYNCKNDPVQRAIWNAERRAIGYAQSKGVLVVASEGNDATDLSHPAVDNISPDFPPNSEVERTVTNACAVVPVEVPGVVGVSATGNLRLKSFYSSYGVSTVDVAAPGGDSRLQITTDAPNGRVLSSYPAARMGSCLRPVVDPVSGGTYCYLQGTSMASPHAVGVAALILSVNGAMSPGRVSAALQHSTTRLPCPDTSLYAPFPQLSGEPQACQGGLGHNSFYGSGEVDALAAVS
jgi:lantibiotic leader peptide-processing serine protease